MARSSKRSENIRVNGKSHRFSKASEITIADGQLHLYTYGRGKLRITHVDLLANIQVKPFLKWAGGKQWFAAALSQLVPTDFNGRFYEPFLGGGSFFFALRPARATLADKNEELIKTYNAISSNCDDVIKLLRNYPYDERFYYETRESRPRAPTRIAARFIYLNRACWNGLYRVNKSGRFNVPFGRFSNPTICDSKRLKSASTALKHAALRSGDFASILRTARSGDFAFLDPPYITGHRDNGFHKYNAQLFSWDDQERLARHAIRLSDRGVFVLITNSDHPDVNALYSGFRHYRVRRDSLIASDSKHRSNVTESIFANFPLFGID